MTACGLTNEDAVVNCKECKHAAAAIEASKACNAVVALPRADEFNVAFMEGSSRAYNAEAGLAASSAKL